MLKLVLDVMSGAINERTQKLYVFVELRDYAQIHEMFAFGDAVPDPQLLELHGKFLLDGWKVFF